MSTPFVARLGGVISADIAVPDHDREQQFYASVLGTGQTPLWREDLMNAQGVPVIGLGARSDEYAELPLQWMPHIQVADIAASVERSLELGGRTLMHGKDDAGASQWAVLLDPNGAAFGLIPVVPEDAIPEAARDAQGPAGHIAWLDLTVADAPKTRDFYRAVVGWSVEEVAMEDSGESYADYSMIGGDGAPAAGVCHARGANLGLPASWLIYLPVGDLGESLERVRAEGGRVLKVAKAADGSPFYAVIEDPVGVTLALVPAA